MCTRTSKVATGGDDADDAAAPAAAPPEDADVGAARAATAVPVAYVSHAQA
jgi:hypothetical protein